MNVATSTKFQQSIKQILENRVSQIHTALPGVVQSYDSSTQIAKVAPGVKRILVDGSEVELPICTEVPVIMPGSGDAIIHFPIKKGDPVLLVFCQRAIDEFLLSGKVSKPSKKRKHALTDSVAIPGLLTFNNSGLAENNDDLIIKKGSSKITIKANGDVEVEGDSIKLGSGSLKKLVNEDFKALFDNHTHSVITSAGGVGQTSSPSALVGSGAISVPQTTLPGTFGVSIDSSQLTSKVTAE